MVTIRMFSLESNCIVDRILNMDTVLVKAIISAVAFSRNSKYDLDREFDYIASICDKMSKY